MGNRIMVDQANLMTLIMLGDEERVINFIKQQGKMIDINESINRMGDTLAHYAAYKGYKHLLKYLVSNNANMSQHNHRRLTPRELATPEIREYITGLIASNEEKE